MLPAGFSHTAFAQVDSTNAVCLDLAQQGDDGNHWITAVSQSAGKGSRGRSWDSLDGNLFASLLLKNPAEMKMLATLTFVTSLAIHDSVIAIAGNDKLDVKLKWPNDVLLNGKKLSGILLENHQVGGENMVIVGIGINVNRAPLSAMFPATSLSSVDIKTNSDAVFVELARAMQKRIEQWNKGLGFSSIKKDWLAHAARLGEQVQVKQHDKNLEGIFEGLSEDGRMLLKGNDGQTQKISTADVFFG